MDEAAPRKTNRLIDSLSPYLLQHAYNPVEWYPWEPAALERARSENKPIFLSIGYAACHWCHVMEHEVFEDAEAAALMNDQFINIKVDREERPDIDEIYMQATLALNNGQGGWPMSVFLTPDGTPFFAATYMPKTQFMQLGQALAETWAQEPQRITEVSRQIKQYLDDWAKGAQAAAGVPPREIIEETARTIAAHFDPALGGMRSDGNKFPPSMSMELMLRVSRRHNDPQLHEAVRTTLDAMARGGIYDHLMGGICRYSTDPHWLVPHFEKMLYDQALVSGVYLDAYQVFGEPRYADVARGILDYCMRDLQSAAGGFYSTRDADSDGLEGKYYIWTLEEVEAALGKDDAELFCAYYDVTAKGNWNERFGHAPPGPKNILNITMSVDALAQRHGLDIASVNDRLTVMRAKLLAVREQRVAPGLDDKILAGWNGLICASLSKAARVLDEPRYAEASGRALDFVLAHLRKQDRLLRTSRNGKSRLTGYLSDYAFVIDALLNQYEATFDTRWLLEAEQLADVCHRHYFDGTSGAYFFTADDSDPLITRTKNPRDGAIPSGNSVHAHNLLRLAVLLNRPDYRQHAESIFKVFADPLTKAPYAFERLLCALDFYYDKPQEIVVVPASAGDAEGLVRTVYQRYLPNKIVAGGGSVPADVLERMPLLKGKTLVEGRPAAYVCQNYRCRAPVTSSDALAKTLWPDPPSGSKNGD